MSSPRNASPGHRPVLAAAVVEQLITDPAGHYVDATFGRGGHSRLILDRLGLGGRLLALDRDPEAAVVATTITDPRFHFVHTRFSQIGAILAERGFAPLQGMLLDLGVSSPQIDQAARGFSFRFDGPLDMRMDTSGGETAAQWLARASLDDLTRVIRDYGEERFAAPIAKAIVARRAAGRTPATTSELAAVVAGAIPVRNRRDPTQHPATRTFQAVRIQLNQELEELALVLDQSLAALAPRGRLAVISFHSLEDRVVKRFIDRNARVDPELARLPLRQSELPAPRLRAIARVMPDAAEAAENPRARSAVLRIAERTEAK